MPEYQDVCDGPPRLSPDDRAKIISRIHSMLYWVGEMIPQEVEVEHRTIRLKDAVYNYLVKEDPSPEERKDAEVMAEVLDKKAKEIEHEIHRGDVSRAEACDLMNEARSYLRAVDELRTAKGGGAEVMHHDLMSRVEDAKRWQRFVKEFK
jgi:predicted CopG family antitoxin